MTTHSTASATASATTANAAATTATRSALLPIAAAAALGLAIVFTVGLVQANTLHNAAHDVRHATGFPCH
jgi:cobalt transporter subunit CbtB